MDDENLEKPQLIALVKLLKDILELVLPDLRFIEHTNSVRYALDNKRYAPETGEWVDVVTGDTWAQCAARNKAAREMEKGNA